MGAGPGAENLCCAWLEPAPPRRGPAVLRVAHDVAVGWETVDVATAADISDFVHKLEEASLHHTG